MYYVDNAALEKPKQEVIEYVNDIINNNWYNPNSVYQGGLDSKNIINTTREIISERINCEPDELIFCSCGSEANTLATCGYLRKHKQDFFVTSVIEHASIMENPYGLKTISVDQYGFFNMDDISNTRNCLVSLQMANSEIGTIQDIKAIVSILHKNNCVVHTDAVACFGKIKIDVKDLDVDMLTATGQKIGGLLGCAFLYKKKDIELEPLIFGHNTLRGGTPNTLAIGALGKATEILTSSTSVNRDYVMNYLKENIQDCYLIGSKVKRLPHNLNVCIQGVTGESIMTLLDNYNIQVSTGSACNSGSPEPSAVLKAIGLEESDIYSCVRLTFNGEETKEDLDYICTKIKQSVEMLRSI